MNGSNKRKYKGRGLGDGEALFTGCLCCLGANQYMSSGGTMGIEILPEETNKSCLFLRSPSPPQKQDLSSWMLSLALTAEGREGNDTSQGF